MTDLERYLSALCLLRQMRSEGVISNQDFAKAERYLAKKYCIKKDSIYRPNDLINSSFRAIYMTTKK